MAPLQPHRRPSKGGAQQSAHDQHSLKNSGPSGGKPQNKKGGKRKYDSRSPPVMDANRHDVAAATSSESEQGIPSLPPQAAQSSVHTGEVWQFRAQSADNTIETDGASLSHAVGGETDCAPLPSTVEKDSSSQGNIVGIQNGERLSTNLPPILSVEENRLLEIASYVSDMNPEDVLTCLLNLRQQGKEVTSASLLDECLKSISSFAGRPRHTQNFPRLSFLNQFRGANSTPPSEAGSAQRQTPTSSQSRSAPSAGTSSLQQQDSTHLRNAASAPAEDQVDGLPKDNGAKVGALSSGVKVSSPSAVYHSKANNISSRSSAKDVGPSQDSPVNSSSATPGAASVGTVANQTKPQVAAPQQKVEKSGGGQVPTKNHGLHFSSARVQDSSAASPAVMNDLNKESSRAGQKDAKRSNERPLKERDPDKYLTTCLNLVRDEYKRLDIARHCGECGNKPRDITFLPCGHVWACRACAVPLYVCPCCNKNIIATVDTFIV